MDTDSTAATNTVITGIDRVHDPGLNYDWLLLAILGSMLVAWLLRKIFWQKHSN
jgi:hypothetical protein